MRCYSPPKPQIFENIYTIGDEANTEDSRQFVINTLNQLLRRILMMMMMMMMDHGFG